MTRWFRTLPSLAGVLVFAGCSLSSNVSVTPLNVTPHNIQRHANAVIAFQNGDYPAVLARSEIIDTLSDDLNELSSLGRAELFAMRLDAAEVHLTRALEIARRYETRRRLIWDLSQVAMLKGDFPLALERGHQARDLGLEIRHWYFRLAEELSGLECQKLTGPARRSVLDMRSDEPAIPRIMVSVNGQPTRAVIDTGSALTIISADLADGVGVRRLENTRAIVNGLLSEPIDVDFGMVDHLRFGDVEIRNVPVAIMATRKLRFGVGGDQRFQIDLLLGTGLLRNFNLRLDYRHDEVTLDWIGDQPATPAPDQNLFLIENRPFVMSAINGKAWYPMMLDTGSEVTFLNLSKIEVRNLTSLIPRIHAANLQGLGGSIKTGIRVENIEIGADRWAGMFDDLPLYRDDRTDTLGILGQNFLANFVLTIDFRTMRAILTR